MRQYADELRHARLAAGLSQARVADAARLSQRTVSRFEAGEPPYPDFIAASVVARVVGLEVKLQCFPAAGQLRDEAHVALVSRLLLRLPSTIRRQLEAPIQPNDQRAWDVLLEVQGTRIGVIAETRIRDLQALLRREHQKQADRGVDQLLLLGRTRATTARPSATRGSPHRDVSAHDAGGAHPAGARRGAPRQRRGDPLGRSVSCWAGTPWPPPPRGRSRLRSARRSPW